VGLFDFWKHKRKVSALLFTDDRVIKQVIYPVEDRYMVDKDTSRAWGLHSGLVYPYKGRLHQILVEHDCGPIGLNDERWDPELQGILGEQYNKKLMKLKKESIKEKSHNMIMMIALSLTTVFVVMILAGLLKAGAVHLPSLPSFG